MSGASWWGIRFARLARERTTSFARARIATFRRALPARCGAFADERRVVAGDEGGRACVSLVASLAARAFRSARRSWRLSLRTGVLSATFRRAASARCGAFSGERRVVAATGAAGRDRRNAYQSDRTCSSCGRCALPRRAVGHRRACASLVASFAAGVAWWYVGGAIGAVVPTLPSFDPVREAGVRTDDAHITPACHCYLTLRCARAPRRIRR
jgi:hypothetical protein